MKQMQFPGKFCVGNDILKKFASYASCYGEKFVFIGGTRAMQATGEELKKSFADSKAVCSFVSCGKLVTVSEIERITALPEIRDADVLCAVGGGSCMDITRTIANRNKKVLVMIPTTVASDAPCSFVSVFYSEDGNDVVGDEVFYKSPDLVLVDSKIIANAPARHIAAGMGDALATFYEATTCYNNANGNGITETAMMLGKLCREIILTHGLAAYRSVEKRIVTPQLEKVIEANCFLSGVGGANTGCSAGHGIGDYLCQIPGGHNYMHGERVYVGLMIQLILEQYPEEELLSLMQFGRRTGLPVCIGDLGVENVAETAQLLAKGLQGDHFMVNLSCDYSENILAGAICYVQCLAEELDGFQR